MEQNFKKIFFSKLLCEVDKSDISRATFHVGVVYLSQLKPLSFPTLINKGIEGRFIQSLISLSGEYVQEQNIDTLQEMENYNTLSVFYKDWVKTGIETTIQWCYGKKDS